jgi:hypothetical protein
VSLNRYNWRMSVGGPVGKVKLAAKRCFIDRPNVDAAIMIMAVSVSWLLRGHWKALAGLSKAERGLLYQTLSGVTGALLGLGVIAVTILFTITPKGRLAGVMESVGGRLEALVTSCLGGLAGATASFALLIVIDTKKEPGFSRWLTAGLVIFTACRFIRLWWLLRRVLQILAIDAIN